MRVMDMMKYAVPIIVIIACSVPAGFVPLTEVYGNLSAVDDTSDEHFIFTELQIQMVFPFKLYMI